MHSLANCIAFTTRTLHTKKASTVPSAYCKSCRATMNPRCMAVRLSNVTSFVLWLAIGLAGRVVAFSRGKSPIASCHAESAKELRDPRRSCLFNLLDDIGDMIGVGSQQQLVAQSALPHEVPLCLDLSICQDLVRTFAVQERLLSFTGEDFDVYDVSPSGNGASTPFVRVRGAMLHLPGKDKMRVYDAKNGREILSLDRKLISATPTYDLYRSDTGEKLGWIEKKLIAMTDTFDVYMEGKGGFGVTGLFKPPPAYRITGDFVDRNFCMRNDQEQVVARIGEDWILEFDEFNHYQVQVAPGVDAVLVLACLCAIDEEVDEERRAKEK